MNTPINGLTIKIDRFYERYPGGLFAIAGVMLGVLTIGASILLYVRVDPTFSIFTHYVSNLGGVPKGAPEGASYISAAVFNMGMLLAVPLRLAFLIHIVRYVERMGANRWLVRASLALGLISTTGSLLVALVPFSANLDLHIIGALVYFLGATSFQLTFLVTEFKTPGLPKYLPILGIAALMAFSVFSYLVIQVEVLQIAGIAEPTIYEWIVFATLMTWLGAHGLHTLKARKQA
jgi:hypothetical membrane protein